MERCCFKKEFGKKLRRLREEKGLTQCQVAEFLKIERSTYSCYERGKTLPSIFYIKLICQLYEISADAFF